MGSRSDQELNTRAGAQGVGRLDVVEDRLVGIKSREIYEAPGAMVLITAHQELEHVTLERELGRYKRQIEQRGPSWSTTASGSPRSRARWTRSSRKTQEHVSGDIRLVLHGGRIIVNGRRSDESLYDFNLATYDEGDSSTSPRPRASCRSTDCRRRSPRSAIWACDD